MSLNCFVFVLLVWFPPVDEVGTDIPSPGRPGYLSPRCDYGARCFALVYYAWGRSGPGPFSWGQHCVACCVTEMCRLDLDMAGRRSHVFISPLPLLAGFCGDLEAAGVGMGDGGVTWPVLLHWDFVFGGGLIWVRWDAFFSFFRACFLCAFSIWVFLEAALLCSASSLVWGWVFVEGCVGLSLLFWGSALGVCRWCGFLGGEGGTWNNRSWCRYESGVCFSAGMDRLGV